MTTFNVTFCRNNWKNTLNPNDVIVITVEANSFDKARKIARQKATHNGYTGKEGWRWDGTARA